MTHDPSSQTNPDVNPDQLTELGVEPLPARSDASHATPGSAASTSDESSVPERPFPSRFEKPVAPVDEVDPQLVDQTKTQIRALVKEIADLAESDCSVEEFYEGFLTRTTSALASIGGAIWIRESADDPLKLHYHINLKKTQLAKDKSAQAQHGRLLKKIADRGEPSLVGPNSGAASNDLPGNPTEFLLIVGPLKIDQTTVGVVEIFQRPGAGPTTQRGYLRFLMQMCDIASDYLRNQRIRSFAQQQSMWQQLEQFIRLVHQGLDTDQTVYTLANEGRRLIDCDRASVAIGQGRYCRIKSVSGLDSIERRAEQVKMLGKLSAAVIRAGQPLWYAGEDEDLPPQIEKKLHAYIDKSHTKMLAIIPLMEAIPEQDGPSASASKQRRPLGALIVEQLKDAQITPAIEKRTEIVVEHGQTALSNATEHNRIFLMPVWKAIGKLTEAFDGGNRKKTFGVLGTLAAALAFLYLFPYSFGVGANGTLIAETQQVVFAKTDGTMESIFVSDDGDTLVSAGQTLALMSNSDIELAIGEISGQIAETQQEISSNRLLQSRGGLTPLERNEIEGKTLQAIQTVKSLENELRIRKQEQTLLEIKSPIDGRVVNWNVRQDLLNRPVIRGQSLMTVVHPDTRWRIELEMPERRLIHLLRAMESSDEPLQVSFGLVSNPGTEYQGELISIDRKLDVYSDDGNTALIRVAFANETVDPELLRSQTRVTAQVHCGRRSIGYVMFHELIETVQSSLMFWF